MWHPIGELTVLQDKKVALDWLSNKLDDTVKKLQSVYMSADSQSEHTQYTIASITDFTCTCVPAVENYLISIIFTSLN